MIHTLTSGEAAEIGVSLVNSSGNSIVGVSVGSITVQFRKQGGSFQTKTVLAGEWNEVGDGIYKLSFSASELNTPGFFRIKVSGAGFETYTSDIQIVDDYLSTAEQVIDIKANLASKVNITDADTLFSQLETRIRIAEDEVENLQNRLADALAALGASK